MPPKSGYHTRAQEEMLAYLRSRPGVHHTAAEIRDHFSAGDNPIGTATIYRQLERFVAEGIVRKYVLGVGESACYAYAEQAEDCASHFHCKCEACGRLIHLDCEDLKAIRTHLLDHHGFAWNTGKTVFYGICGDCRKKG